jgi:hypothetical protein
MVKIWLLGQWIWHFLSVLHRLALHNTLFPYMIFHVWMGLLCIRIASYARIPNTMSLQVLSNFSCIFSYINGMSQDRTQFCLVLCPLKPNTRGAFLHTLYRSSDRLAMQRDVAIWNLSGKRGSGRNRSHHNMWLKMSPYDMKTGTH